MRYSSDHLHTLDYESEWLEFASLFSLKPREGCKKTGGSSVGRGGVLNYETMAWWKKSCPGRGGTELGVLIIM